MAPEGKEPDVFDRALDRLEHAFRWPSRAPLRPRVWVIAIWLALLVAGVLVVSNVTWRADLPRSTIMAIALGALVLMALWLFGSRGSKTVLTILATSGAILVAAGTALDLGEPLSDGPPDPGDLVDCPDYPSGAYFHGTTPSTDLGYVHLREKPGFNEPIVHRYPPDCRLAFDGYCLADPKDDWRFDVLDPVWFRVVSGDPGYVASADVKASPAGGNVARVDCGEGARSPPGQPEITAPLQGELRGPVEIAVAAPGAIQVGFAVFYEETPGDPETAKWHQIGVDLNTGDGATTIWDSRSVPGQSEKRTASVVLLAVPCNGLDFPSELTATRSYAVANKADPSSVKRPRASTEPIAEEIRSLACSNVER